MKRLIASVVISLLLFGCDQDRRRLSGGYYLKRLIEGGTSYYVIDPRSRGDDVGGVFDGTVEEIGWNQDWILARVKRIYHGDVSGWYALNLKTKQITGPFQELEVKRDPNFANIKLKQPADLY